MATHKRTKVEQRLLETIGSMPYGATLDTKELTGGGAIDLEMIVEYLVALRLVLVEVDKDEQANEGELGPLRALRNDLRAAGRLLRFMTEIA